jgi:outer membrane immunogenic protein
MKKIIPLALIATLAAPAAFAGSKMAPVADPVVTAPAPAMPRATVDWTGAYAGATLGFGRTSYDTNDDEDNGDDNGRDRESNVGVAGHVGYNADMGNWVVGGELAVAPGFNQTVGNREVRWGATARLKAGPKFGARGETWAFGSVGLAHARHRDEDGSDNRSSNGWTVGVGASHMVQENVFVTGEVNHVRFDGEDNVRSTGVALGVSFRF